MVRVVLDANVVVSGWLQPPGPSAGVLDQAVSGRVRVVLSPAIAAEYRRSLGYPRIRRRLTVQAEVVDAWVDALALLSDMVPGERRVSVVVEDPGDDKYVAAAIEGRATFIVSGDHHLLDIGAHDGVRILSPRAFLELLAGEASS